MKRTFKVMATALSIIATVLVVNAIQGTDRKSVGGWDTDDHPDPETSGDLLPKPAKLISANGYTAVFPSGHKVTLRAISRDHSGPKELNYSVNARAWLPDGSPYYGEELRPSSWDSPRVLEGSPKGVRYLAFDVTEGVGEEVEVYGYIPETARKGSAKPELHGRDIPTRIYPDHLWGRPYRAPIVVEGNSAKSYRFGLASGAWKEVYSTTAIPTDSAEQVIGKGPWGKLRMVPPKKYIAYSGPGPFFTFIAEGPDPVEMSYRVRAFDKYGNELTSGGMRPDPYATAVNVRQFSTVAKVVVETRPFTFVEFKDVHFDPEFKKWGWSYWGSEGEAKIAKIPDTIRLEGILRPHLVKSRWKTGEFFAPDGVAWREYPKPDILNATFYMPTWPDGEPFVAIFSLDGSLVEKGRNAIVEAFESTSAVAGEGLGRKLEPSFPKMFDRVRCQAAFVRPSTDYVQFKVRASSEEWAQEGEAAPPTISAGMPDESIEEFTICVRGNGSMDYFYHTNVRKNELKQGLVRWKEDGREIRVVARLKSGEKVTLAPNGASIDHNNPAASGSLYIFSAQAGSDLALKIRTSKVALKDIQAFEVESRSYGKPQYLVAKLPPKKS